MGKDHIARNVRGFLKRAQAAGVNDAREVLRDYPHLQAMSSGGYTPMGNRFLKVLPA